MYSKTATAKSISSYWDHTQVRRSIEKVKKKIENADTVVIGAGAEISASAGFTYSGKRFKDNFADFIEKCGFRDMYSAGFYPYDTPGIIKYPFWRMGHEWKNAESGCN